MYFENHIYNEIEKIENTLKNSTLESKENNISITGVRGLL